MSKPIERKLLPHRALFGCTDPATRPRGTIVYELWRKYPGGRMEREFRLLGGRLIFREGYEWPSAETADRGPGR